jgi:hypothetical protein
MRMAGLVLCALAVFTWVFYGAFARVPGPPVTLHQAVDSLWKQADGPTAAGDAQRSWVWGPEPLAQTTEYYSGSSTGTRSLIYFDKARLDILDPGTDTSSTWFATGGLLVSEMLAGEVQLGEFDFVSRPSPQIAVAGDLNQPNPVTYATLAAHSSLADDAQPSGSAVGTELTALLTADGNVDPNAMSGSGVIVADYSDVTGHNIAEPFQSWARSLPYPELYLLGHPVTEPYWIETQVLGTPKTVLVQAFERRVMTYTPDIPAGLMVESANAGQHYRLWRGLEQPADPDLAPLASGESFGEELVAAAVANGVDPYMLVAISQVVSGGNALHSGPDGQGLMNVSGGSFDPQINAESGAQALRTLLPSRSDVNWPVVLTSYFGDAGLVGQTMDRYDALVATYAEKLAALASAESIDIASFGGPLSSGPVAHYDPSYTTDWWEWALTYYESIGLVAPNWSSDPSGYYCVRPGYLPGERLRVNANGRTLDCTIGDMVADRDLANWLSKWSVEMNWPMFVALGLDKNNHATVEYPGDSPKPPPTVFVPQTPGSTAGPTQPAPVNPPSSGGPAPVYPPSGQEPAPPVSGTDTEQPQQPAPPPPPVIVPPTPAPEPTPEPTPLPPISIPSYEYTPPTATPEPTPEPPPAPPAPPADEDGPTVDVMPPSR